MSDFLCGRLPAIEAQIIALEGAFLSLSTGAIQSYTLDTGQDRQTVTVADLDKVQAAIDGLYNRHATISARCNGGGTLIGRPAC